MTIITFCVRIFVFSCIIILSKANNYGFMQDNQCGIFYSNKNFSGSEFVLTDFDQSVSTKKDYRTSVSGWQTTGSILVHENCTVTVCSGIYFDGTCHSLPPGRHQDTQLMANIKSAKCNCERVCRCEDIYLPKRSPFCGKVYPKDSCNKCHTEFSPLEMFEQSHFFGAKGNETVILRSGCNLTFWTDFGWDMSDRNDGIFIKEHVSVVTEALNTYQCDCDDNAFVSVKRPTFYPPLIELPETKDQLTTLLWSHLTENRHPGLEAALESLKNKRNANNAYIMIIGAHSPTEIGLIGCSDEMNKIGECHFSVDLDKLGIANAELRVIYAYVYSLWDDGDDGQKEDDIWIATLAEYLTNHEDLKDTIPNVVVLLHKHSYDDITNKESKFQRQLKIVNSLRPFVIDDHYSNIIFYLSDLTHISAGDDGNLEPVSRSVKLFEDTIRESLELPEPIFIVSNVFWRYHQPIYVDGFIKIQYGKYIFRIFHNALNVISEKSGDPIGHAIFNAVWPKEGEVMGRMAKTIDLLPVNHAQVKLYRHSNSAWIEYYSGRKKQLEAHIQDMIAKFENHNSSVAATNSQKTADALKMKNNDDGQIKELTKRIEKLEQMISQMSSGSDGKHN